jgi:hypothetical protein
MPSDSRVSAKIADPDLKRFVDLEAEERRLLLVEPELPARQLRMQRSERVGPSFRPVGVEPEDREDRARRTAEAEHFLGELLHCQPRWLDASRTFVVEATGREVAAMIRSPLIKAIHPNRRIG